MTEEQTKRMEFLQAYEDLGPGGLTPDETLELAELRIMAAFGGITFVDCADLDDGDDAIINTGNISSSGSLQTVDDIKYFFEKLMRSNILHPGCTI